jgi:hypothetical protein
MNVILVDDPGVRLFSATEDCHISAARRYPIPAHWDRSPSTLSASTGILDGVGTESEKKLWASSFPVGEPDKDTLARLIEEDSDEAETALYEHASDPTHVAVESAQRHYRGMLRRRLRHLRSTSREH